MNFVRNLNTRPIWRESISNLAWYHRAYLVDWGIAWFMWLVAEILKWIPVHERDFALDDPIISHPYTHEQVSSFANWYISVIFPIAIVVYWGLLRRSSHEAHHGALACWTAFCISHLVTDFLKNRVGRLRPDFLARCEWSDSMHACTGSSKDVHNGRMSFPSGHSSTAFSGLGFLFLFLAGKTGALHVTASPYLSTAFSSRLLRLGLAVSPLILATWIAVSRLEDYRHHKEDVIVGSLIGFASAYLSYTIYWENPFSDKVYQEGLTAQPRLVYDSQAAPISASNYELANGYQDGEELEDLEAQDDQDTPRPRR